MLFCTLFLCISNICILSTLSNLIEGREPVDLRRHVNEKALMYLLFGIYISLYYAASITEQILILVKGVSAKRKYWLEGLESLVTFGIYVVISLTFHPCFFTDGFRQLQNVIFDFNIASFFVPIEERGTQVDVVLKTDSSNIENGEPLTNPMIVQLPCEYSSEDVSNGLINKAIGRIAVATKI